MAISGGLGSTGAGVVALSTDGGLDGAGVAAFARGVELGSAGAGMAAICDDSGARTNGATTGPARMVSGGLGTSGFLRSGSGTTSLVGVAGAGAETLRNSMISLPGLASLWAAVGDTTDPRLRSRT